MGGIDWNSIGQPTFDQIVDTLLVREFGTRGHAVNGRGGDGGIDYTVDNDKIIFQYKYFPDGFTSESRRTQIKKSFKKAMTHDPDEWILVVPAVPTPWERRFVTGLGRAYRAKILIRDRAWLDDQLSRHRDIDEHFRFGSDIDFLYDKGERFKHNPVIRDMTDVADRMVAIEDSLGVADADWGFDIHSVDGQITQVLRPKDPNAAERSPITISFTAAVQVGSPEAQDLENANAFG